MDLSKLYGKGLYRILRVFHKNKGEKLNFREICRLAKLTEPASKQHLQKLSDLNIIQVEKFKNLKLHYLIKSRLTALILSELDEEESLTNHPKIMSSLSKIDSDMIVIYKDQILLINHHNISDTTIHLKPVENLSFKFITVKDVTEDIKHNSITIKNGEEFYQI